MQNIDEKYSRVKLYYSLLSTQNIANIALLISRYCEIAFIISHRAILRYLPSSSPSGDMKRLFLTIPDTRNFNIRLNPTFAKPNMPEPNNWKFEYPRKRPNPTFSIPDPSLESIPIVPYLLTDMLTISSLKIPPLWMNFWRFGGRPGVNERAIFMEDMKSKCSWASEKRELQYKIVI